ncbi:EAL domain-containing protein [Marinicella litoralis]|uniref:EAL domain-containing protein n=1 Tax=Marinicella litoralis TaxID=644220 RepID=UPI0013C351A1|nr:EAL domain-containing protein [Marinicella litoralis]
MNKPYLQLLILLMFQIHDGYTQVNKKHPPIKVGYFDTPPLSFINSDGNPDGFIVDLLNEIAGHENFEIIWVHDNFPQLMSKMRNQELDAMVSTAYSDERALFLNYSELNFSNVWGQVFLPKNSNVESVFDLDGKTIALMENDFNGQNFISQCDQFEVECNIVYGKSYQQIYSMLAENQVDAAVSNNLVGAEFQEQFNLLASSIVFNPFKVYISAPKGADTTLIDYYDQYMKAWKEDIGSFYFQTRSKWTDNSPETTIPFWLIYTILGLVLFALVSMVAAILFKRQVKRRVTELTQKEIQLNQIINILPHMIFANDYQGKIILVNEFACRFLGIENQDVEKKNIYSILKSHPRFKNLITYTTSSNPFNTEVEVNDLQGNKLTLMMSKVPYSGRNDTEPAMVTVGFDISQTKQYEEEIEYLANHDSLTGLPNRILLSERLKTSLSRAKQFNHVGAIIYIDLDNFKNINDSQGHKIGDKLIKKVATVIKKCVHPGDTIARQGGDEFVIELPELNNEYHLAEKQAYEVSDLIINQLKKPILIEDKQYNITASVGLVVYPRDGERQSILLQRADTAMNEAKLLGKNRIHVFEKSLETKVIKNHQLENDLRLALQNHEITMVYHPIVDASTLNMVGAEILLRWQHPTEGLIMPTDFIPIAESAQLILEIGYWTIEKACEQILKWQDSTKANFFIAVNLSVVQIRDKNFLDKITDLIYKYKIPRNFLEFEVTESILLSESERSIEIINQLKLMGIKLSIDDFGTGYSSFDYIRKLPLDKIKVDKSFIQDIPHDSNSVTIVKTILNMANEMNLEVVAEGVETAAQIKFLRKHNCQFFQGFYFSKPKPVDIIQQQFKL